MVSVKSTVRYFLLNKKQRAAAPSLAQQPAVLLCKIFAFVTQLHNHADKLKNKVCCNSGAQTADRMTDDSFSCHMRTVQADIMPTCVLKYPLQHIHIAVNTAISFAWAMPVLTISGTRPIAAPAAPRAVIGTATAEAEVKTKQRFQNEVNTSHQSMEAALLLHMRLRCMFRLQKDRLSASLRWCRLQALPE